jgi:iron complex outermembrane recepter protein
MGTQSARATLTIPAGVALILAAAAASAQQAAPAEKPVLGEVVVTAQKRVQALADIPMSVSVLPGETLERQQADNFQDLTSMVPGLSLNSNQNGITRISLRGINTGGVASTVGVYVNEVPFGSSSGLANAAILSGDFDTFDLARVEVLRGPQGTLYGASSLGGVIKYVANEPSTDGFEARFKASFEDLEGGDSGYAVTGVLNMPVSETIAVRASGFFRSDGGYTDSIGNNPIPALQDPSVNIVDGTRVEKDINGSEVSGGRLSALFKPSDSFSLDLTAYFQSIDSDNANTFEVDPATLHPLYDGLVASRYQQEFNNIDYKVFSGTINWDFGAVSLQSVTSYSEFSQKIHGDVAVLDILGTGLGTAQLMTFAYSTPGTTDRLLSGIQQQTTATDKFTQEFRLLSPESEHFEWLLGAFYTDEDSGINPQSFLAVEAGTEHIAEDIPPLAVVSLDSTYEEIALFANATWHITPKFDFSFGARWSDNDQTAEQNVRIELPAFLLPPTGVIEQNFDNLKSSESPFTWSVSPRFEISDTTSTYLRVATGFRPGGPNVLPPGSGAPATYKSDELTSYELGLRTGTADGKFTLDIATFYLDWDDIQLFQVINNFGVNANGGKAKSKGLELTATVLAAPGFTISLNGAYTNADLSEDTDPAVNGHDGDPLPWVPDLQFALGADYEWAVGASTAYIGGQIAYTGERMADFGDLTPGGQHLFVDDYTTIDLRTGLEMGNWSIELYGKNLGDKQGITDFTPPGQFPNGAAGLAVIRPRTIGVSIGARF